MKYAVLDLETTGHGTEDQIIQVGLVIVNDELQITDKFSTFVKPRIAIPEFITNLTGIDHAMTKHSPEWDEVALKLLPFLEDAVLVAHNVGFDASFLDRALQESGYMPFLGRKLDTIELLRILYPSLTSYQLGMVTEQFGIAHDHHHRADSDAAATAEIFITCARKLRSLPLLTVQRLSSLIDESKDMQWFLAEQAARMEQHTVFEASDYDYYRQFALQAGEWSEEKAPRQEEGTDAEWLADTSFEQYLNDVKRRFQELFPGYEEREAQSRMFQEVHQSFEEGKHLLIEAGTGTGKSLGYLIPALYYSIRHHTKMVVSTHTINLQEQLRHRDLPLLAQVLPFPFKASILKGRGNYLCMRKFEHKLNARDYMAKGEDGITAASMVVWLSETETGDQEELNFSGRGAEFWSTVASDANSCLNRACPWFKRCYYHRAKHESNIADVCITNHSMLFTDVQADHRLLPAYNHLVIDEAHHVEEVAGKHLGTQVNYFTLISSLTRMQKDARSGILHTLRHKLRDDGDDHAEAWVETIDDCIPKLGELKEQWDKLFEFLFNDIASVQAEGDGTLVKRLSTGETSEHWQEAVAIEGNIHVELARMIKTLEKLIGDVKERSEEQSVQGVLTDLNGCLRDLSRLKDELRMMTKLEQEDFVFWLEGNSAYRHRSIQLYAAPIDVSRKLQQYFFDTKESIVLTSATLTVKKTFQYAEEQLGLAGYEEKGKLRAVQLPSPFQYREQALVIVPRDFPLLKGASYNDDYLNKLVRSLRDVASGTRGRMLVLFTSYRMLRSVYDPLKESLAEAGINVLGQGIDSSNRTKLTRRFLQQPESVLLGTSSFWEGVDIPGESLICLAIVRLPFQPPSHPVLEAKAELLQRRNQNPFMKLSIPGAVIKFKQGFGRLVRSSQDKGIVIIYDTRVIETFYGKHFLYSLPGPKIETMHADQMVPRMEEWLSDRIVAADSEARIVPAMEEE
ncbi:ATP-dependent DNA helicase DinG [Paenibacillus sp. J5C_2022]|uniref:ATP-dependent DNA helicase DinG n=1 Tax=Paenibacillus sp. J5C2022 TaxID=2977129 RepID=UPI0021CEF7A2|nr:ATP-dependent DNA helicase DinG [Paenibacillus sp. J5C2022]MCU6708318.1 ATP-dependent DNA helicase DinG [Paenibacillus sp. J5C2022]